MLGSLQPFNTQTPRMLWKITRLRLVQDPLTLSLRFLQLCSVCPAPGQDLGQLALAVSHRLGCQLGDVVQIAGCLLLHTRLLALQQHRPWP